jgi:hypothetical protein
MVQYTLMAWTLFLERVVEQLNKGGTCSFTGTPELCRLPEGDEAGKPFVEVPEAKRRRSCTRLAAGGEQAR